MFKTILSFFTGSGWIYGVFLFLCVGVIGTSWLSVSLLKENSALHVSIEGKESELKERDKLIDAQAKEVKRLDKELAQAKADIQTQNALNEQYAIESAKKEKAYQEALAKKPLFRTRYITIERTNDSAKDLDNFVTKWRTQP